MDQRYLFPIKVLWGVQVLRYRLIHFIGGAGFFFFWRRIASWGHSVCVVLYRYRNAVKSFEVYILLLFNFLQRIIY
jgi:hypothetical protein